MTLHRYTLGVMRRRPGRTLLTLAGIAIGVATIVGISVSVATTGRAYQDLFETVAGKAALEVVAEGYGPFDAGAAEIAAACPGVAAASPTAQAYAALPATGGGGVVLVLGVDAARDATVRTYRLLSGSLPGSDDGVALEANYAESLGLKVGSRLKLLFATGVVDVGVTGLLTPEGLGGFNGGAVAIAPLPAAQRWMRLPNQVNSVQIVTRNDVRLEQVERNLTARLPRGLRVQRPAARAVLSAKTLFSTEQGLGVLSVVSIVAGAFVILNTFLMNLAERRRELAILRTIGGTGRQVARLVLGEAALLGVIGTGVGIPLGLAMAAAMTAVIADLFGVRLPGIRVTPEPLIIAALIGPLVALASAFFPARRAARRRPLEDLVGARDATERLRRWPIWLGVGMIAVGLVVEAAIVQGRLPRDAALVVLPPCMAMLCTAVALVAPGLIAPLLGRTAWLLGRIWPAEMPLALRQLRRHPTRTGLTAGVLLISLVVSIGYGNSMLNNVRDARQWCERVGAVDYFVRGSGGDPGTMTMTVAIPRAAGDDLARLPGVARVHRLNFVPVVAAGHPVMALAQDFSTNTALLLDLVEGDRATLAARLASGEVAIGTGLALRAKLRVGDTLTLATRDGPQSLPIAAVIKEYTTGGMNIGLDWSLADRLLHFNGVHVYGVVGKTGEAEALRTALAGYCATNGYQMQSQAQFRAMIEKAMAGVVASCILVMAMVFVVASLGVVNTLTMGVLEQTREIGVLRAVAMRRAQVRRLIVGQAAILALACLIPGGLLGLGLSKMMNLALGPITGMPAAFAYETPVILGGLLAALAASILAGLVPSRRAERMPIVAALRYE